METIHILQRGNKLNNKLESIFSNWAQGPSKTEQQRSENAELQIRKAIEASTKLKYRNIKVFTQGSYRNRVNVKKDSDVDVGVVCFDTFFPEFPDDNIKETLNRSMNDATYTYATFKDELYEALVDRFGYLYVSRGNKSFDIKENTYRVEADVAAFFEHRRYSSADRYISGVEMRPDNRPNIGIRNWPEQHYENGVAKNEKTGRKYKRVVRILKTLANAMADDNVSSAKNVPSFLIECMVWNVPNKCLQYDNYVDNIRSVLAFIYNNTVESEKCREWGEVSDLKYLFRTSQPWTVQGANAFVGGAWDYLGFK
jgi:hypothetical protein